MLTHKLKGQVSIEFLLSLLLLIIILYLFISTNIKLKDKIEKTNYNDYNLKICTIKKTKLIEENGSIYYDSCNKQEGSNSGS